MAKHIGFVSTRFAGTDGVTLESSKWADVLQQNGYRCFWFAGDNRPDPTALEDEYGLCFSTWIKGQSICSARIRQAPQKKAV